MAQTLFLNVQASGVGLETYTYTVPTVSKAYPFGGDGLYNVEVQVWVTNSVVGQGAGSGSAGSSSTPTAQTVTASGLSYTVNKNGVAAFTSAAITPFQTALQSKTQLNLVATDIVTVVLASSTAIDKLINSVQSQVAINQGI